MERGMKERSPINLRTSVLSPQHADNVRAKAIAASRALSIPAHSVITDTKERITKVNSGFVKFTGYSESDFLGRKCNFLQGHGTDPLDVNDLKEAVMKRRQTSVVILNYCKDGHPFWNILTIKPLCKEGVLTNYIGEIVSIPVPDSMLDRPKLCIDDALQLIKVFSSIPRILISNDIPDKLEDIHAVEEEVYAIDSRMKSDDAEHPTVHLQRLGSRRLRTSSDSSSSTDTAHSRSTNGSPRRQSRTRVYRHKNYLKLLAGPRYSSGADVLLHSPSSSQADDEAFSESASSVAPDRDGRSRHLEENDDEAESSVSDIEEQAHYSFVAETNLPTGKGRFRMRAYRDEETGEEPLAMIVGSVEGQKEVLCRVHDQCVTSEVFGSLRCDCKEQLDFALGKIQSDKVGMVIYLPQEGRGIGLANKVAAYAIQEMGLDTVDANRHLGLPDDARQYDAVRDILEDLGIQSIRLMTNNPRKMDCLAKLGVNVVAREPCITNPNSEFSLQYVSAKAKRMGHIIDVNTLSSATHQSEIEQHDVVVSDNVLVDAD